MLSDLTLPAFPDCVTISPSILYFGTPVVLIVTRSSAGSVNITPISSAWALGQRVVLGFSRMSQGCDTLLQTGDCTLNFPSSDQWQKIEAIARTTGRNPVPGDKAAVGYEYCADKFTLGGFTPVQSNHVAPPRIAECPLQLEARTAGIYYPHSGGAGSFAIVEVDVLCTHAHTNIVIPGTHHIDTGAWSPLLYVFRHYFGTAARMGKNFRAET